MIVIKRVFSVFLIISVLVLCCACTSGRTSLGIYVFDAKLIKAGTKNSEVAKIVKKSGRLIFDGEDIEGYNWSSHQIKIKKSAAMSLGVVTPESGGSALFKTSDKDAFAIMIGGRLIYYGGFEMGSSNPGTPLQPYISDTGRYTAVIKFNDKYAIDDDPRLSSYFYNFLNKHNMLITQI